MRMYTYFFVAGFLIECLIFLAINNIFAEYTFIFEITFISNFSVS